MLVDELLCEHILHVAGIEQRIGDAVDFRIHLGILDGLGHILDTDDLARLARHKVGNRSRTRVQVVHQFVARQSGKLTRNLVEVVCLSGIRLIERFRSHLETQSLHLLEDMVVALEHMHVEVVDGIVALIINNV